MCKQGDNVIKKTEALFVSMLAMPPYDVRDAVRKWSRAVSQQRDERIEYLVSEGFELLDVPADRLLTDDGREILHSQGKAWALRPEVHAQRLAEALAAQKARDDADVGSDRRVRPNTGDPDQTTKSVVGTEALAEVACPKCGDAMQRTNVCPKCAAGKAGLKYRYTCPCGVEFVTKDKL